MFPYQYSPGDEDSANPWIDFGAELSEAHFNRGSLLLRMHSTEEDKKRSAAGQQPTLTAAIESLQVGNRHLFLSPLQFHAIESELH
eukprot:SAG31_NODE_1421_length_8423_cov_2.477054_2_plen_86_part_00